MAAGVGAGAGAGAAAAAAARPSSRLTLLDLGCNDEIVSSPELTARLRDAWKKVRLRANPILILSLNPTITLTLR